MLRRIYGPKTAQVTGVLLSKRLPKVESYNRNFLPNNVRMIKPRKFVSARSVARSGYTASDGRVVINMKE